MGPSARAPERPFVGLRPFQTDESLLFFGRQRQVVELLERLHRTRFVGVVGSSGSGKSSLILAGLIPALRAGFLVGDRDRWVVATMTPGDRPWPRLAERLACALATSGQGGGAREILQAAESGGVSGLVGLLAPLLAKADANLLLLLDQFEEIFRRDPDSHASEQHEEDADFVSVALGLAGQREAPVFVVLTMRSDHLGDCDDYLGLPEALNESQYLVPRLSRDQVREAIEGPIRLFGKAAAPRLIDRLLNDLGGQHDQLPVLQHALMRMWVRLLETGQPEMDLEHYADVGTLADALSRHAEEALAGLDPGRVHAEEVVDQALAAVDPTEIRATRIVFQALTDTDHAHRQVRRWQSLGELQELTGLSLADLGRLLDRFRDDRRSFLRLTGPGGSTDPATLVDISHESLIRQWVRLRSWVQEEARDRAAYVRIRDDARRWEAGSGGLWVDPALAQARLWWDGFRPTPVWARRYGAGFETAKRFLLESERRRDKEIREEKERNELRVRHALVRRTLRRTAAAAVVAGTLALVAGYQWRRAEVQSKRAEAEALRAESGEHAARSLAALRTDGEEGLRQAILAVEKAETETSAGALREALAVSVVRKRWSVPLVRASAVAFSADGRVAAGSAAGEEPGRAAIWDVGTGRLRSWTCGHSVAALRWSPDGRALLLGLEDGGVVHWDATRQGRRDDGTRLVSGRGLGELEDIDVRPDGGELALAAGTQGLLRFDLVPGAPPSARPRTPWRSAAGPPEAVASVAYSLDGRVLAVGGSRGTVTLLDTGTGEKVCETSPLGVEILRVGFSGPELGRVAASAFDHTLRSWPVAACRSEPVRFVGHRDLVTGLAFAGDGDYLVSVSLDSTIKLWDPLVERDETFSRWVARYDSGRAVRHGLGGVATVRPVRSASPGSRARALVATVGAEQTDAGSNGALTLWDVAARPEADAVRALRGPGRAVGSRPVPDLLRLARELRIEPAILTSQSPACR
jgi:energy-coupling factor transporter ATP-binding protein EcfA2